MDANKKILVVEDEKNIALVLAYNIKKEGYDCDVAYDGETGLNMALAGGYDLILLDIMLPKMTGFEVCEHIRYKSHVPIIFVTAREEEKDGQTPTLCRLQEKEIRGRLYGTRQYPRDRRAHLFPDRVGIRVGRRL